MHEYQPAKHYKISREEILYFFPNYEDNNISKYGYLLLFCFSAFYVFRESFHLDSVVAHIKTHVLQH